jgi:hypothetical protein
MNTAGRALRGAVPTIGAALAMAMAKAMETIIGTPACRHPFYPSRRTEDPLGCYGPFRTESTCAWAMFMYPHPIEGHWYEDGSGHAARGWWFAGRH